jgi:hypothetical protein
MQQLWHRTEYIEHVREELDLAGRSFRLWRGFLVLITAFRDRDRAEDEIHITHPERRCLARATTRPELEIYKRVPERALAAVEVEDRVTLGL